MIELIDYGDGATATWIQTCRCPASEMEWHWGSPRCHLCKLPYERVVSWTTNGTDTRTTN